VRILATLVALFLGAVATLLPVSAVSLTPPGPAPDGSYAVLQMNLCLSGSAACYPRTAYPAVVDEAAAQVMTQEPEAVTLNEACRGDAADLARRTGYRMRFAAVRVGGAPIPCVDPGRRGEFGLAVLTRDRIRSSYDEAFRSHAGLEERRWLCVTTADGVSVCTAHLGTRESVVAGRANDAECSELRNVLARYDEAGDTVFGGDVNRRAPCAPSGMWAAEDVSAAQLPGIQHIYGSLRLRRPSARVAAAGHTDHDFFLAAGSLPGTSPVLTPR
jgi:endonuclease/exonuclease/phosphatase family metal-dependent hydrolase